MPAHTSGSRSPRTRFASYILPVATLLLALSANVAWAVSETPLPQEDPAGTLSFDDLVEAESRITRADTDSDWVMVDEDPEDITLTDQELEKLVSRVALYPDELLAAVLAASTFPVEIVQASRYLERLASEPDLEPDAKWDESILALLNYPEVLEMMNNDLDWTWDLGESVILDQTLVMDSIQVFRRRVQAAGNLESNEQRVVMLEEESIAIQSADPEVVYVPVYRPARVVVTYSGAYPYNYWGPYPWYYYSSAPFWTGWYGGVGYAYGFGWGWSAPFHRPIIVHHRVHHRGHGSKKSHRIDDRKSGRGEKRAWRSERSRGKSGARPTRSKRAMRRSGESEVVASRKPRGEGRSSFQRGKRRTEQSGSGSDRRRVQRSGDESSAGSRDRGTSRSSFRRLLSQSPTFGGRSKGVSRSSSGSGRSSHRMFRSSSSSGSMKSRSRGSSSSHRMSRSGGGKRR